MSHISSWFLVSSSMSLTTNVFSVDRICCSMAQEIFNPINIINKHYDMHIVFKPLIDQLLGHVKSLVKIERFKQTKVVQA